MSYPVFKGATRPVMILGVPQIPLFFVCAAIIAFSVFVDMPPLSIPLCFVAILIMRGMVARDDYIFRLLFLNFTINIARSHKTFWGVFSISPLKARKIKDIVEK